MGQSVNDQQRFCNKLSKKLTSNNLTLNQTRISSSFPSNANHTARGGVNDVNYPNNLSSLKTNMDLALFVVTMAVSENTF